MKDFPQENPTMFMSGIADEAGKPLDVQIKAHKELGWDYIELRNVEGGQFHDLDDAAFERAAGMLADAGLKVSCFASAIANWACKITDDFERDRLILARSIPRMQKLCTPFIRVMSYPNDGLADDAWRDEAVRRLKVLSRMAADGGVTLVCENCDGWASQSAANYGRIFELVDSPAFKAVYDTGNAASHGCAETWPWYLAAKPHIAYIHIKAHTGPNPAAGEPDHTWPEDGSSLVAETLQNLFFEGYDGGISIEPHLKAVVHENKAISDEDAAYATYVEYGRRAEKMVREAMAKAAGSCGCCSCGCDD